jgi:hypothetical protein
MDGRRAAAGDTECKCSISGLESYVVSMGMLGEGQSLCAKHEYKVYAKHNYKKT